MRKSSDVPYCSIYLILDYKPPLNPNRSKDMEFFILLFVIVILSLSKVLLRVYWQRKLQKVALLLNEDRLHFHLKMGDGSQSQIAPGDCFVTEDLVMGLDNMYEVRFLVN